MSRPPAPDATLPLATTQIQRLLALAAVCQAAQLVVLLATQGEAVVQQRHGDALQASLSLGLCPDWAVDGAGESGAGSIFQQDQLLAWRLGLQTLERLLMPPLPNQRPLPHSAQREVQRHIQHLLRLSRASLSRPGRSWSPAALSRPLGRRKAAKTAQTVGQRLKQQQVLSQRLAFFDGNLQHPALLAGLAELYIQSTQGLRPRLVIRGQSQHMSLPVQADRLRACLWSGLVAAALWHQSGGSWLQLILKRRSLLDQVRQLARQHFYTDSFFTDALSR